MGNKAICIIPARGGSKRIPGKNIKLFYGKPVIAYSIEAALNSGLFEEVMVSTDDQEIITIAKKYGANVPFLRSKETSGDFATTTDVINEVLASYKKTGKEFDIACCLYATAPFVTVEKLQLAFDKLKKESLDCVFPVLKYSHPVQRSMILKEGKIAMREPQHLFTRSQDLEPVYHDAGMFYWFDLKAFGEKGKILTENSSCIVLEEIEAQDIDNEVDWQLAEIKYKLLHQGKKS